MTETPLLLRKVEESLRAICHERCVHALFLKIAWWDRSLHCDWKTVGKTASRQAKVTDYSTYSCDLPYHFSSIFRCTNYSLI